MSIRDLIESADGSEIARDDLEGKQSAGTVEVLAEELAHRTNLSNRECIVLAGDKLGMDDGQIGVLIKRGRGTVQRTRAKMRKKYREETVGGDTRTELSFYFEEA